jgi:excisionase family DNA binding protein
VTHPHFVATTEAAELLGCGRTTVYGYINSGDLHPIHHGRRTVISVAEIGVLASRLAQEAGVLIDPTESNVLEGSR